MSAPCVECSGQVKSTLSVHPSRPLTRLVRSSQAQGLLPGQTLVRERGHRFTASAVRLPPVSLRCKSLFALLTVFNIEQSKKQQLQSISSWKEDSFCAFFFREGRVESARVFFRRRSRCPLFRSTFMKLCISTIKK